MNIQNIFSAHIATIEKLQELIPEVKKTGEKLTDILKNGNKIFFMGNGGSAADSQHMAAELIGRFRKEREAIPAIALTTDTSIITAVGNDYSYATIFERQINALALDGDAVIGISTSGNSENIIKGILAAKKKNCFTLSFTGKDGGKLKEVSDMSIIVPSDSTPRIQEAHLLIGHIICELIEEAFCE